MNKNIKVFLYAFRFLSIWALFLNLGGSFVVHAQDIVTTSHQKQTALFFDNLEQVSPNKTYIALVSADNLGMGNSTIWVSNIAKTDKQKLVTGDKNSWVTNPIWSPDSTKLAYLKVVQTKETKFEIVSRYEIWAVNRDGSNNVMLTNTALLNPALGYGGKTNEIKWNSSNQIVFLDNSVSPANQYALTPITLSITKIGTATVEKIGVQSQPVNVPYFSQKDGAWGGNRLGTCTSATISSDGCAITSVAMVLKYYGVNTNPAALNTWLTNNGGYDRGCLIYWAKAANMGPNITFVGSFGQDWNRLKSELDAGYPVILELNNGAHYVVATGYSGSTYYINDPASSNIKTLASYGNTFSGMRIYHGPISAVNNPPAGYIKCADENGRCNFTDVANVVYGARTTFTSARSFTNGTPCNNSVFGDPLVGVGKSCYYYMSSNKPPAGYTKCADENGRCSFSGSANVVYGAWSSFTSTRSFTNGVDCNNNVFGDPLGGVRKACYYYISSNNPPAGYTKCADENGQCNFSGTANVVYGAQSSFTSPRSFTNTVACNNNVFGDPISGVVKACYYSLIASNNLALQRFAWSTSQENSNYPPYRGNDGDFGTRWSSQWSPLSSGLNEWWFVDLGSNQTFDTVSIRWETAFAATYYIGWSNDAQNFLGYTFNITSPGDYRYNLGTRTARYVGIQMSKHASCCGNFSFYELGVYRSMGGAAIKELSGFEVMTPHGKLQKVRTSTLKIPANFPQPSMQSDDYIQDNPTQPVAPTSQELVITPETPIEEPTSTPIP